jgi:four helix bundle protein
MSPDDLEERLIDFASRAGKMADALPDTRLGRHVAGQLIRCATSPAPNYSEACAAESRADFIHKLMIALKEKREARCWIRLVIRAELLRKDLVADVLDEATQLARILGASVVTAKTNAIRKRD